MNPYIIGILFISGFGLGMFSEHKLTLASETVTAHGQTKQAQDGEVKIIQDTQTIYKDIQNAKDKCTNAPVPNNINNLLRK